MTTAADDSAVEDAFEALLAGRPAPQGSAGLAAFTEAVRTSATRPGRPNAALADLLATGLLTDQSSPSARTARSAGSPPARRPSRVRIRRRTAMIFPVLFAKFLSAGAVAQAATGAGFVVVAVTGAGAVGVLPDPVQDTVAGVVETVTPLDLPSTDDEVLPEEVPTTEPVTEEVVDPTAPAEVAEDAEFSAETWAAEGPADYATFGAWVSEGARNKTFLAGDVKFSEIVREWAHRKGLAEEELEAELESEGVELEEPADGTTDVVPDADAEVQDEAAEAEVASTDGDRKQGGAKGSGKSKGNGRN